MFFCSIDHLSTRRLVLFVASVGLLSATLAARADSPADWPEFHGPQGEGYSSGTLPGSWDESDYAWRRKLPAYDVGSPAIFGDRVYYLTSEPRQQLIRLESLELASGELRWSKEFPQPDHHLHSRNTFASSTPAVDEQNVFVAWSNPAHTFLKCFDHDGNEVWSRDFGRWQSQHGFGTSPKIFGGMVLLFNSQQGEQLDPGETAGYSRMIAVDRKTGDTIWQTPLKTTRTCYGVPAIYRSPSGSTQIIAANTGNGMFGLDAESGNMLWNLEVFSARCCSTPLIVGDLAIASSGSGGGGNHLVAVRIPDAPGEQPEQVYRIDRGAPYVPTPALHDGRMYIVDDKGFASCVDPRTGKIVWGSKRIGGTFGASPVVIGDTVLLINLDGEATLLKAADTYQQINQFDLGGPVGATPAYANGYLLLRVGDELRCLASQG